MRHLLPLLTTSLLALLCASTCAASPTAEPPPNIVIIFADDLGYADVEGFGNSPWKTPHLKQMAEQGSKLTSFYVAQPVCSASRAALLTGSYPNRVGVAGAFMPDSGKGLAPAETTMAEVLKTRGYRTGIFGKWHLGDAPEFSPNRQGFDEFYGILHSNDMWPHHPLQGSVFNFDPLTLYHNTQAVRVLDDQSNLTQELTDKSIDFIAQNRSQPFFLYLAHPQPHVPLFASEAYRGKSGKGLYADVIMELDASVGAILGALQKHQLDDNTLVIFTSDNGPWLSYGDHAGVALPYREGKGTSFEGGVREPFIARWPGQIPAGTVSNTPLMAIDLLPTIANLAGAALPQTPIDGKDAWSVITGEQSEPVQQAYFFYYRDNELQAVRYGPWKLYYPHAYQTLADQPAGQGGEPVNYTSASVREIQLYNVERDPSEQLNLASKLPDVVDTIKALTTPMRTELGDSLTGVNGTGNRPNGTSDKKQD